MHSALDINAGDWDEAVLKSETLVVVDFWHEHCPWCIKLDPVFNEVAEEYKDKVKFVKLNVMQNPDNRNLAIKNGIMGTPTLSFFCEGRSIQTVAGFQSKDNLKKLVDDIIEKHRECIGKSTQLT